MERTEWLKRTRAMTGAIYDRFAPLYWDRYGLNTSETHARFLGEFLGRVPAGSRLLSAGCGAGKHDGRLLAAGHDLVGIDLSAGMLGRAREKFPQARYIQMGLQEMDFEAEFEGAACVDALEHVFPEDWPVIVGGFRRALKPGGWLYFTVDVSAEDLAAQYALAKAKGLPVVYGEVATELAENFEKVMGMPVEAVPDAVSDDLADRAVYHYCPPISQVRAWLAREEFIIQMEGIGQWYHHFLARS